MAPTITFLPGGTWNSDTEAAEFWAAVNGRRVRCRVFWEALDALDHSSGKNRLDLFAVHRRAVEAKVEEKILAGVFETDGTISIREEDVA